MAKGIVYIVQNPAFSHLIKIGFTTQPSVKDRNLDSSNVPEDYNILFAYECENPEEVEKHLHKQFNIYRHFTATGRKTEFFFIGCATLARDTLQMLEKAGRGIKDITEEFQDNIEEQQEDENKDDKENYDATKIIYRGTPSKRFNFNMLKIPMGAILHFFKDESKTCQVTSEDKVLYQGEEYSLSPLALKLVKEMGYDWPTIQGPAYFKYNGELLTEIRRRLEKYACE